MHGDVDLYTLDGLIPAWARLIADNDLTGRSSGLNFS